MYRLMYNDPGAHRLPGRFVLRKMEATIGFEPMHRGFAGL